MKTAKRALVLNVLRMRARGRRDFPNADRVPIDDLTRQLLAARGIRGREQDALLDDLARLRLVRIVYDGARIAATLERGAA